MSAQHLFNAIFNATIAVMIPALVAGLGLGLAPLRKVWVPG